MGKGYLLDTSAYGRYLENRLSNENLLLMNEVLSNAPEMSVIVKIELMSYRGNSILEKVIHELVNSVSILNISDEIINKTIEIRRKTKIKLPDAIIAATAIVNKLTLLSCNDADFLKVPKLKYHSLT